MSHTGIPFPQRIADRAGNKRLDSQTQGYRGKCRISTRYLRFNNGRVFSEAKVREWRNIFSLGGCDRYSKDLVLAAIVSHDQLSELDFDGNMIQQASSNIECLYGREMITAAQDYLPLRDDWWYVDIYHGPNETVQEFLKAEFLERSVRKDEFTDGEIFRKIRLYAQEGNFESSRKWWSRLSPTKANNLKQLLKNNSLSSKFDSLLKFPGLWPDIQLGMFHTLHGAKCPEEICTYLDNIYDVWTQIIGEYRPTLLDHSTVQEIQLLDPRSKSDRRQIEDMFRNRKVFLQYGGVVELSRLQANVMQLHRPIITIFTLLEDLKYLESCSKSLRLIFNPASGQSMRVCMKECWKSPKRILQIQEFDEFQPLSELMNHEELFSAVYLQIWIYAMRNFHMLSNSPRKDPGYPKPQFKGTHPFFAFRLALLARELGFENTLVDEILHENAYRNVARAVLSDLLSVDTSISELEPTAILDRLGDSIKDALERIHGPITIEHPSVLESTNNIVKLKRCGRPYMQSHQNDRNHLYLRQIVNLEEPSSSITSIHVKRAFIFNFWGGFLSGITTGALLASNRNPDHERDTAEHSAGNQPTIRVEQMEIDGSRSDTQAGPERRKGTNKRDHASAPMQNALEVGPRETRAKAAKRLVQDNGVYNIFAITNNALIVGVDDHNYQGSISFSVSGSRYQLHFHKNLVQSRIIDLSGSYNLTDCIYLRNGKSYQNKQASQAFALSEGIANIVLVPKNLGPANIIHQVIPEVHSQLGDDLFNILRRKLDRRTE